MNYMWMFPAVRFFSPGRRPASARTLRRELDALLKAYPDAVSYVVQNLLDSHDVGRIATVLKNRLPLKADWDSYFHLSRVLARPDFDARRPDAKAMRVLRQLVVFQMTYLGAPMIYYGTEAGMWGANDPDNRQPMLWDDVDYEPETHTIRGPCRASPRGPDRDLLAFYRRAIRLRKRHAALRRGGLEWLRTEGDRLLGFSRFDGREEIVVLLNAGDRPASYRLARPAKDLWERPAKKVSGTVRIPPRGWRVLRTIPGSERR